VQQCFRRKTKTAGAKKMTSGWQLAGDAPTAYTRSGHKIMEPWTDDLILAAGCRDGDRVLDVACGTGIVANRIGLVTGKLCSITGIDLNDGMLSVARRNPQIEWHQGNASDLPFESGSFEVVLCQQGLQYFPDRAAAMREMARVLSPGGRLALNVWGALERQPFHAAVIGGIGTFLGAEAKAAFDTAFSLNTANELRSLARDAGLQNIHVRFEHRTLRHPVPAGLVALFMGATPVTAQFLALSDDRRQAFISHVVEQLASYVDDSGLAVPAENHFLTASKPV
jgi:ubiquinone/menaquinone biosynthesis C-methylase UbiE